MLRPIGLVSRIGQHLRCLQMWVTGCGKHRSSPKSLPDFWKGRPRPGGGRGCLGSHSWHETALSSGSLRLLAKARLVLQHTGALTFAKAGKASCHGRVGTGQVWYQNSPGQYPG